MPFWNRLSTLVFGGAIGAAARTAIEPQIEPARQHAWSQNRNRVLDPGTAAQLVAQALISMVEARDEAGRNGYDENRIDALIELAIRAVPFAEALELWRRGKITEAEVDHVLAKGQLDGRYWKPLKELFDTILTPGELAAAIHRGLVPDAGLLLGEQPQPPFKVEAYPVQPIDAIPEAQGSGYDRERLQVLVGLQGLPMGPHEAAQALFRGIITHGDYIRAFNTSNMRNEWAQAILDQTRQIPTARDFMENALRGYSNLSDALVGAARHGMSEADATLIYQNQGRPMNIHQITQALARGANFNPEPGEIKDPYLASIVEGPLKPAYYEFAESLKYTLPSTFAMRQLAQSGVWSEAKTAERLKWAGWLPQDAEEAAHAWAAPAAATTDPYVSKAQTQLWNRTHTSYIADELTDAEASTALFTVGVDVATVPDVLAIWQAERDLIRAQLSAKDVVKAFAKTTFDRAHALDRLVKLGYSLADANTLLDDA